jgi:putative flippase GtrA
MLEKWIVFWNKNKQIILYLFFGVCTTLINTVCYGVLYEGFEIPNVISTILSNVVAVLFSFVTNKLLVFESKTTGGDETLWEMIAFFGWRFAAGVLEVIIMYVAVDVLQQHSIIWKLIANVVVIVMNYFTSKWLVFKDKRKR